MTDQLNNSILSFNSIKQRAVQNPTDHLKTRDLLFFVSISSQSQAVDGYYGKLPGKCENSFLPDIGHIINHV
jgi:hypothetical protein